MVKKIAPILAILSLLLTSGFGCRLVSKEVTNKMKPVTLNYWRVWDGPDAFEQLFEEYKALHPFITINYRKLRYNEYEQELLNALAEDRGPDIFSIHNTWIKKYETKISPLPPSTTMAYPIVKGSLKKEVIPELRTTKSIGLKELKNNFIDVVLADVIARNYIEKNQKTEDQILGLPLSVDTLVMYYNKDLFNNAGISQAPAYWNKQFQDYVKKLTKQDKDGFIIQSGVALGGSSNIERFTDILSVLMMQNGATMISDNKQIMFDKIIATNAGRFNPGLEALRFYADFSNPAMEVYSWNKTLANSISLFAQGKVAMIFGYSYHLPTIKAQAPKLNLGIAKLPQIEGNPQEINFANYWVEAVSNKSKYINEAWNFIQFAAKAENVKSYLENAKKPTALRSLINGQIEDEDIGAFAEQLLTAKSWYRGADSNAAEKLMGEMIDSVVAGQGKTEEIISLSASKIQQTLTTEK